MATVKKVRKSTVPYYAAAAAWVIYALLFDLYRVANFVTIGALSLGLFLLLQALCKDVEMEVQAPDPPKVEEKPTGNAALDKALADGAKAVSELRRLNGAIADENISADIDRMEAAATQIFTHVRENPEKLDQIRRFTDYYLPTVLKLLNAYDRMDATGVSGQNISASKERVAGMMDTVASAFEKQLDSLFGDEALDISGDISVLNTMLSREGLTGDTMEAQTTTNGDGSDIRLDR